MIAYRVEIWCNGCAVHFGAGIPHEDANQSERYVASLTECATAAGWTSDGAAHFCPACQRQRSEGPIADAIAITVPPGETS
jgi:hypothetical protein